MGGWPPDASVHICLAAILHPFGAGLGDNSSWEESQSRIFRPKSRLIGSIVATQTRYVALHRFRIARDAQQVRGYEDNPSGRGGNIAGQISELRGRSTLPQITPAATVPSNNRRPKYPGSSKAADSMNSRRSQAQVPSAALFPRSRHGPGRRHMLQGWPAQGPAAPDYS